MTRFSQIVLVMSTLFAGNMVARAQTKASDAAPVYRVAPQSYALPRDAGVAAKVLLEQDALEITAPGDQKAFSINLGWMPVQSDTTYYARYRVRAARLDEPANVYLLMREHTAEKQRPITPYHVESSTRRTLPQQPVNEWQERVIIFKTGENTRVLSGAINILKLKGTMQLGTFELWSEAAYSARAKASAEQTRQNAQAEYETLMTQIRAAAAERKQLLPRTLVFSRSQMKYTLGRNYYHEWNDRPLLASREYRVASPFITPLPSYKRTLEEVRQYAIDGLAFFPETKGRMAMFEAHEQANVPEVQLLPEFIASDSEDALNAKTKILQLALKSTFTPRINGKVLVTSYTAQSLSPEQWKTLLTKLRERVGDMFIFLPALTFGAELHHYYVDKEPIPAAEIENARAKLRSYLDVCDGIYFNYPPALYLPDHTFDDNYYRDIFIPIYKSVLAEPAYRQKYFGLSAYKSHMNPDRGNNFWQDGTRTLRSSFETAMNAKPDVIVLPEWDEQNENTSFRPTVYGARTNERILRYEMSRIKSEAPTPVPGDDTAIPNFILSSRKIATIGENLMFELLNIPDGTTGIYSAQLILQDENGRDLKAFDPINFDAAKITDHRLYLATETVAQARAINPVVKIKNYKGHDYTFDSGFHAVQLRATWNWDYLYVNQPLRDILRPVQMKLSWEPADAQNLILSGTIIAPEKLNLAEVLGDDDEAFAVDPRNEFFRADPNRELVYIDYRSMNTLQMQGVISLKNATAEWLSSGTPLHQNETESTFQKSEARLETPVSVHQRWMYLAVPKSDIEKGEIDFNFDKAKFTIPLKVLLEKQIISRAFEGGLIFTVKNYHRQIDMPRPLNVDSFSFRVRVRPEIATEQYHLRLITREGKIYRSRPLLLSAAAQMANTTLRVYSAAQKRGVDVAVAADRIPALDYAFDPSHGAVMVTEAGVPFWSTLGGFSDSTTGRGTINALFRDKYPAQVTHSNPDWVQENGRDVLQFSGKSTFLELPREALPSRSSFTLLMEINPETNTDQSLLLNGMVGRQTGLMLQIRGGKLWASFRNADWKITSVQTDLAIPAEQWSRITVRHDFEKLTLDVNGQSESIESTFPANNIGFTVIGASWSNLPWFTGKLRQLKIVHNSFTGD